MVLVESLVSFFPQINRIKSNICVTHNTGSSLKSLHDIEKVPFFPSFPRVSFCLCKMGFDFNQAFCPPHPQSGFNNCYGLVLRVHSKLEKTGCVGWRCESPAPFPSSPGYGPGIACECRWLPASK